MCVFTATLIVFTLGENKIVSASAFEPTLIIRATKKKVPPCLIKIFGNWPEKLIILFVWPKLVGLVSTKRTPSSTHRI